jgi:hypothetical protein
MKGTKRPKAPKHISPAKGAKSIPGMKQTSRKMPMQNSPKAPAHISPATGARSMPGMKKSANNLK